MTIAPEIEICTEDSTTEFRQYETQKEWNSLVRLGKN
jgi:hypothetical protein